MRSAPREQHFLSMVVFPARTSIADICRSSCSWSGSAPDVVFGFDRYWRRCYHFSPVVALDVEETETRSCALTSSLRTESQARAPF
jgi:hypothetical protein